MSTAGDAERAAKDALDYLDRESTAHKVLTSLPHEPNASIHKAQNGYIVIVSFFDGTLPVKKRVYVATNMSEASSVMQQGLLDADAELAREQE